MADISDVKAAMGQAAAAALTAAGVTAQVNTGWPDAEDIDHAADNGYLLISVYEMNDETDIPRLPSSSDYVIPASTLSATVSSNNVTFAGTANAGGNVGVSLSNVEYAIATTGAETMAQLAAAFAGMIPGASAAGAVLTVPVRPNLVARVGVAGISRTIIGWVQRSVMVTAWAPNAAIRDLAAAKIDSYLRAHRRLALQTGDTATLFYHSSPTYDRSSAGDAYRRDVVFSAQWPVTSDQTCPQIIFADNTLHH